MKHLHTFESFSALNEAKDFEKVQPAAKEFLQAVKDEFKTDIEESQLLKMAPKGFEVRAVIKDQGAKMYAFAKEYTAKHKDDVSGVPLDFKISPAISGRSTLWPTDNKKYFDIEESENFLAEREFSKEKREELAKSGAALPDGSYPIENVEDLKNAIKAYGRAKDQAATAKHIAARAKALGKEDMIPQSADFQGNLK
jgi:hypothetical protein